VRGPALSGALFLRRPQRSHASSSTPSRPGDGRQAGRSLRCVGLRGFRRSMASISMDGLSEPTRPQPPGQFWSRAYLYRGLGPSALRVVPHFHTGKLERPRHLVAREQTQFDTLAAVLDACPALASQVMCRRSDSCPFLRLMLMRYTLSAPTSPARMNGPADAHCSGCEPWLR